MFSLFTTLFDKTKSHDEKLKTPNSVSENILNFWSGYNQVIDYNNLAVNIVASTEYVPAHHIDIRQSVVT